MAQWKKNIVIGLLAMSVPLGCCTGLRATFGFFTPYNYWTAQRDIKKGKVQIVEIGELPMNYDKKQHLANTYGFDILFYGCNISWGMNQGTRYYNHAMISHIQKMYGARKWAKLQTQLDSIDHAK